MANIPVERKGGASWLWWVLGLILAIALIWILVEAFDDDTVLADVPPVEEVTPGVGEGAGVTISDILGNPTAYVGQEFPGAEVNVTEVPTDRSFWIDDEG